MAGSSLTRALFVPAGTRVICVLAAAGSPEDAGVEEARQWTACLLGVLPPERNRRKEPDPQLLYAPHTVPNVKASALRLCTFNLLHDSGGVHGVHGVWELRRVNVLRVLLAIDADAYLLQASL